MKIEILESVLAKKTSSPGTVTFPSQIRCQANTEFSVSISTIDIDQLNQPYQFLVVTSTHGQSDRTVTTRLNTLKPGVVLRSTDESEPPAF